MPCPSMRVLLGGLLMVGDLALVLCATDAHAEPRRKRVSECADAAEEAQSLRRDGHPTDARRLALVCSREDCPDVIRRDCRIWGSELEAEQATLVVRAREPAGAALVPTRILIDHRPSAEALEGRTVDVDPGEHVIQVDVDGRPTVEVRITIAPKEHANRIVDVPYQPRVVEPAVRRPLLPSREPLLPTASWIAFGLGAAALGSFAYFGIRGNEKLHALRSSCSPACSDDQLSPAQTMHLVADVSLGAAIVSAAVGTWLALGARRSPTTAAKIASGTAVVPMIGGAAAVVERAF